MVMSDTKEANRNGKKSSPLSASTNVKQQVNDDLTSETSEDDESNSKKQLKPKNGKSEFEEKIRVGKDYQAVVPTMLLKLDASSQQEKALLVWSPPPATCIPDSKLEEYVTLAKERYGYNSEQALGMLFWHKHDLGKAVIDLANFTPFPDEWSKEDKVLFEQAFQFHGKCFHRIRQMLPDKSIASLVKFYYSWKKTRSRTSVMDRQEKRRNEGTVDNSSDGALEYSDDEKKWSSPIRGIQRTSRSPARNVSTINADNVTSRSSSKIQDLKRVGGINRIENKDMGYSSSSSSSNGISKLTSLNCQNCKVLCNELHQTIVGGLCSSCFQHWRRTGNARPVEGPNVQRPRPKSNKLYYYQGYHDGSSKYKKKPPKGMYINHDDVLKLAGQDLNEMSSTPRKQPLPPKFDLLAETDREINVLYSQIQKNKQKVSSMKKSNEEFHDTKTQEEVALNRVNLRWTKEEISLAILGCKNFGQDFKAIAEVISTKTESHVRKFFNKYRKSLDLDKVCQESEVNNAKKNIDVKNEECIEVMEVIDSDDDTRQGKNENELLKIQGKDTTVVTAKSLKRKLESVFTKEESDEESTQKKIAPLIEKAEITITPIQKVSAIVSDDKQNGTVA